LGFWIWSESAEYGQHDQWLRSFSDYKGELHYYNQDSNLNGPLAFGIFNSGLGFQNI